MLDEPCAKQSDPTVLDLQLRTMAKQSSIKPMVSVVTLAIMPGYWLAINPLQAGFRFVLEDKGSLVAKLTDFTVETQISFCHPLLLLLPPHTDGTQH